ncbi:MAG: hypothetical protein GOMPHAMPRED_006556 [Gomphillus americanus]|uniref:Nucleoside phosphorylase domain-containing protein n=1 Tax=Gomphillus americanus TaxID=1940652 RepID=A0A8H3IYD5_9LECA|nr:MAG: hypothetical protein GOMPHAMPRED_006556 [Gomphillus americanus]
MSGRLPARPVDRRGFKIGIVCALSLEAELVGMVFDQRWSQTDIDYGRASGDLNIYTFGVIAGQNIVLAHCQRIGNVTAAQVALSLKFSFTEIQLIIIAGICGAAPSHKNRYEEKLEEIYLGDCLISTAVFEIDFGRQQYQDFRMKNGSDGLGRSGTLIDGILQKYQIRPNRLELTENLKAHLTALQQKDAEWTSYPGVERDRLYCARKCTDLGCGSHCQVLRTRSETNTSPRIHFGHFGSSNAVLASGLDRDKLAKACGIIAFEMESAGVWRLGPTVVIKAACDYADAHKNDDWQKYAAAVAAAGLKAFLTQAYPSDKSHSSFRRNTTATTSSLQFETWDLPAYSDATAVISSDFTMLAYGPEKLTHERNATIRVHNLQDGANIHEIVVEDQTQVRSLAFDPEGKLLASSHGAFWYEPKRVKTKFLVVKGNKKHVEVKILLWDMHKGTCIRTCEPHTRGTIMEPLITMSFNAKGDRLAVVYSSDDQTVERPSFFIINIRDGSTIYVSAGSLLDSRLGTFSPDDGQYFVHVGKEIAVFKSDNHERAVLNISIADNATAIFKPDGSLLVIYPNGNIHTHYQDRVVKQKLEIEPSLSFGRDVRSLGRFTTDNELIIAMINVRSQQFCIASPSSDRCKMLSTNGRIVKLLNISLDGQYLAWWESRSLESAGMVHVANIKEELEASNGSCWLGGLG